MTFLVEKIDEMLQSLFENGATGAALPSTGNVFNTDVPGLGAVTYPILEYHEAGTVVDTCCDGGVTVDGVLADYVTQVYSDEDDYGQVTAALAAVEADMMTLAAGLTVDGVRFTLADFQSSGHEKEVTQEGRRYVKGWHRWQIFAQPV